MAPYRLKQASRAQPGCLVTVAVACFLALFCARDVRGDDRPPGANDTCPVMSGEPVKSEIFTELRGKRVYFCCRKCKAKFEDDPEQYLDRLPQFAAKPESAESTAHSPERDRGATAGRTGAADAKTLEAVLFATNNEELHLRRRKYRLSLLPQPPRPPDVTGPVYNDIDRFIVASWSAAGLDAGRSPPPICSDEVFLRRVYLDLIGVIPSVPESQEFLNDRSRDKRAALVDALLARNRDYADHWTPFWEDALGSMTVDLQGGIPSRGNYRDWINKSFRENKPYDVFAAELIDPTMPGHKNAITAVANGKESRVAFVRNETHVDTLQTAAIVGQVFLGTAMKCASCHSHFENDEWPQTRFLGFAGMFAGRDLEIIRCEKKSGQIVPAKFAFDLPGVPTDVPAYLDGRLRRLAQLLTDPANPRFAKAIVNRLWKRYIGLGLFEPADDFRLNRPATHPKLLEWLAADFMRAGYDLKHTIRMILTSRTYQLQYDPALEDHFAVSTPAQPRYYRAPSLRRLTAEQFVDSARVVMVQQLDPDSRLFRDVTSTALTRALGKPASRNEISTARPDDVAVVQALELLNGTGLRDLLSFGGLIEKALACETPRTAVELLYRAALTRDPTERESRLASEYVGAEPWHAAAPAQPQESVWFDDELPGGVRLDGTQSAKSWRWARAAKHEPHRGRRSHTGREAKDGPYQHYFLGAAPGWTVHAGERLFTYVFLDPANPPREIMIQWNDGTSVDGGWAHRAYWGEDAIMFGQAGTASRRRIGLLPEPGQWIRLEIPAAAIGLGGANETVVGMSFDQSGGRVYWDESGVLAGANDPRSAGLTDLLWALVVSPEFQYIR